MQTIVLLVLWVLGTSLVLPDPDTAGEPGTEEPIPCSIGCSCMHDDYSLELNMYCSARNLTQIPLDIPLSTHSIWLDDNLFTSLPAASFKDLTNLDFLNLQNGQLVTLDPQAFKGLRSLAHIHLERNRLRALPGAIFQNTPNLASLSLQNNQLTRIEERLFVGLSHMWLLNLGRNSITVLPETAFHDLHGLRELVLAGNRLPYLQPQLFQNLVELKELDLTGNHLKVIKANVFVKLTKLQKLYLGQNHIVTVVPRAFAGMKSLRWLDLTNNRLTTLHEDSFVGLHSLHVLRLSNNSITGIKPRTFRDLQFLEELRLSYNRIQALGERIFEGLGHLEMLELEHNQVQQAQVGSFTGLPHVAVINLAGSCFHSLPDQVFKGLSKLHSLHLDRGCLTRITTQAFSGLSSLRRLFLQHNNISEVERQSFVHLVGLLGLDLSFNNLEVLTTQTFSGLKNLEYLLLSKNNCRQFLQNGTKQILPKLRYLDLRANALTSLVPDFPENMEKLLLSGNRWKCDCNALPLRNYSMRNPLVTPRQVETHAEGEEPDTTITLYNNITCTSPPRLAGQDLRDIDRFYWQTVETRECVCKGRDTTAELHTEVSVLSFKKSSPQLWGSGTESETEALVFCRPHAVIADQKELEQPSQCLLMLLRKENAMHHSIRLPEALMRELKAQSQLTCIHHGRDDVQTAGTSFCFHVVPYSNNCFHMFVREMWAVPDPSRVILSQQKSPSSSTPEQLVILTLCGKDTSKGLILLHRVLARGPEGKKQHAGFQLLGLKRLPALTQLQGATKPLPCDYPGNLSVLMSPTPEVALRQVSFFSYEHRDDSWQV
ncbi:uncharacterized protein V6R79_022724 [Siganus canaliculatus]